MSKTFNKILQVVVGRSDMKKMMRLGKYTSSTAATGNKLTSSSSRPRPLLIQFRDRIIKNQVMESLFNLKGKEDIYSKLIFAYDLTPREREECKQLVQDAKNRS